MHIKRKNYYRAYVAYPDVEIEYHGINLKMEFDIIGIKEIKDLMSSYKVVFILGNVCCELKIISIDDTISFWKENAEKRIVEPEAAYEGFRLEDYPGGCCYLASIWKKDVETDDNMRFILLTVFH